MRLRAAALLAGVTLWSCGNPAPPDRELPDLDPEVALAVEEVLNDARHPWLRWPDLSDVAPELRDLTASEPDALFWFARDEPHPALPEAIDAISSAADRGLDRADYDAERIGDGWKQLLTPSADPEKRAHFDLAVTIASLRLMKAVHSGRVDPRKLGWGFDIGPKKIDRIALLREAREGSGFAPLLDELEPSFPHYSRNRRELARYRRLARKGEPPPVPPLPQGQRKIEPGELWDGVLPVRERLLVVGDLAADAPAGSLLYDEVLVAAVKRFQGRHVLDADGVIGPETIEAMNVSLAARARQIELAMERGRWLPRLDERPTVFVNVPIFRLWASDPIRGDEPLRMKVVVGKSMTHSTPIFMEQMQYVVFRPFWNPPHGITTKEILPQARRDQSYLDREMFEIVATGADDAPALPATRENLDAVEAGRLYLRQKPGPRNSLGLAKFIFPNRESVYMHGTPAQQLFSRTRRDFSHGCIRVEDATALAEWVLREVPGWTRERIAAAMSGERPTRVNLPEPLMVVIFYDTVHVNSEGVVHFATDIYGHDRALDAALARGYPYGAAREPLPESSGG